jgi:hypothetical protein
MQEIKVLVPKSLSGSVEVKVETYDDTVPPVVVPPVVEPPVVQPPVQPPSDIKNKLKSLFLDQSKWTKLELVWEYSESSGGVFVPINRNEFLQQNRSGGKIRWFVNGIKRNCYVRDNRGIECPAFLHDAKYHNGVVYGVFMLHEEIWIGTCKKPGADKPMFDLTIPVRFEGAKDTKHAIEIASKDKILIYGRLRHGGGVDWPESGEPMGARRGVRRVIVENGSITSNSVYFDPAKEQPGYEINQYRYDYYTTRFCHIEGVDVQLLSCYQKNSKRIPSTRPERTSGTGPIIPIVALGREILSHTITPVKLSQIARRTNWVEAQPYEPEVGQCYGVGLNYDKNTGDIDLYFNHRWDTHYLTQKGEVLPNVKVYRISTKITY